MIYRKMKIVLYLFALSCCRASSFAAVRGLNSAADQILNLPGISESPSFSMFSGYLQASGSKHLHYWFNHCVNQSSNNLIIWFSGGPGCSSLNGLFLENGPFKFGRRLEANPYSWNKLAHTLYIESPVGVGFSYDNQDNAVWYDENAAEDTLKALKHFFRKFPDLLSMNVYISGEGYAGVSVPLLLENILHDNSGELPRSKFRGLLIGNGLMDVALNEDSIVYYAYYHGLFGSEMWNQLQRDCCRNKICHFLTSENGNCRLKVAQVHHIVHNNGLNPYNLYAKCHMEFPPLRTKYTNARSNFPQRKPVLEMEKVNEPRAWFAEIESTKLSLAPDCSNAAEIISYLNRDDVKGTIHVNPAITWEACNEEVMAHYDRQYDDMSEVLRSIFDLKNDFKMLLYYGDLDMVCNHLGGEWFVDRFGYEITRRRGMWKVEDRYGQQQVAGFYKTFGGRLTYAIVKGAGHMVSADKPLEAFNMVQRFLNGEHL